MKYSVATFRAEMTTKAPPQDNPIDEAPPSLTDDDPLELHRAIGSAISTWVLIESELADIFAACLTPSHYALPDKGGFVSVDAGLSVVMETVDNFRMRLVLIDAAIGVATTGLGVEGDAVAKLWALERKKLSGPSANRNKLAHWNVINVVGGPRLVPPHWNRQINPYISREQEGFTASDVEQWEKSFELAASRLRNIYRSLCSLKELHRKLLEPAASLMRSIARHDPAEFARLRSVLGFPE